MIRKSLFPPAREGKHEHPTKIINEISRLFAAKMRENDKEMAQESVRLIIICLAHFDGSTQLELVQKTHLSPPTVSITVKKLEKSGYVSRVSDEHDQRAIHVYLTEKGRELDRTSREAVHKIDSVLMQNISPEENEILQKLLLRMRNNFLEYLAEEGDCDHK